MEEEQRLEDLRTQKLLEAAKNPQPVIFSDALDDECDLEDEDLYSTDLKAQLKAAQD